jgi:hypothetical protein
MPRSSVARLRTSRSLWAADDGRRTRASGRRRRCPGSHGRSWERRGFQARCDRRPCFTIAEVRQLLGSLEGSERIVAIYPNDAQLLQRIRELIAAEAACCSFLKFTLEEKADSFVTELRFPQETPAAMRTLIADVIGASE